MAVKNVGRLDDTEIKQWLKNNIRFDARADGNGLYIRFRETDKSPVFFFRFKLAGVESKIIMGKYPALSLSKARTQSRAYRTDLDNGKNPAAIKRQEKMETVAKALAEKSASTVGELVDDFFKRNIDDKCSSSIGIRQSVDKHIIPVIGAMKIEAVKPMHISNMLDGIHSPTAANKVLSITKRIFNHAIKRHTIDSNPAAAFDNSDAGGKESPRDRFLSESEIIELFKAMSASDKFSHHHYLTTKLLFLIGCRKGELFKAKSTDFDFINAVWVMSLDNKTKSAITIPLSSQAIEIIRELMKYQIEGSLYLFPTNGTRVSKSGCIGAAYLNKPIRVYVIPLMNDCNPFVVHDLRRTMRTHLTGSLGANRFVAERCLNHKIAGMEGVYDSGDYLPERRAALDKWANFLESCEAAACV
ncbi:MAG: integrase arm-type DNA-binding domain-containing protein [Methylococcaceae bacterium]